MIRISFIVLATLVFSGCTAVSPWERGTLAKPEMQWSSDALRSQLSDHIYFAKEATSGGFGAAGGGCGCN